MATLRVLEFDLGDDVSFGLCVSVKLQAGFAGQWQTLNEPHPAMGRWAAKAVTL